MTKKLKRPIVKELDLPRYTRPDLKEACDFLDSLTFTAVKTKYNKKGQCSAVSLRGYSDDFRNLLKPTEPTELRDTELTQISNLVPLIEMLAHIPAKFERVIVMKNKAGTSVPKHIADVDELIGFEDGKIIRIHIPLRTSDNIYFYLWKNKKSFVYNLEQGKYYYIDVTKPHGVHNKALFDRLHLVVDCYSNDKIRALILQNEKFEDEEYQETEKNLTVDP